MFCKRLFSSTVLPSAASPSLYGSTVLSLATVLVWCKSLKRMCRNETVDNMYMMIYCYLVKNIMCYSWINWLSGGGGNWMETGMM